MFRVHCRSGPDCPILGKFPRCLLALESLFNELKPIRHRNPLTINSDISALINRLTAEVNQIAVEKTGSIQQITNQMKMLALNALIESSRAGAQGAGFAVVAQEVRGVGQQVETIARELETPADQAAPAIWIASIEA